MSGPATSSAPPPVIEARSLLRRYHRGGEEVTPLDGLDLSIHRGEIIGIVGPSGVGKSTLARCLCLDETPDAGTLRIDGVDPRQLTADERRRLRRRVQLVPQDPVRAVASRWSVEKVVAEPLVVAPPDERLAKNERRERVRRLLRRVGLADVDPARRAHELSGGQLQRLVIARALACDPRALVLDESLTGLDLSLQARTVNLLRDLLAEQIGAHVLISHDHELVAQASDRVLELRAGRLEARTEETAPVRGSRTPSCR